MATLRSTLPQVSASQLSKMPGDSGVFLFGSALEMVKNPIAACRTLYDKYGEICWTKMLGMKVVMLMGPDAAQFVLQDKEGVFSNKWGWDFYIGKFFSRGVMLLDFDEHKMHRRIMAVAFKKPSLVEYLQQMNPVVTHGIENWVPQGTQKARFMVYPAIKKLTLDMASVVFLGEKIGEEADRINHAFVDCVRAGSAWVRFPVPGLRYAKGVTARKVLEEYFASKIAAKRTSNARDMFAQLCHAETEDGQVFSDEDVINHMIFLMMAAHDTSTITLSIMFNYLAKNPEWQEKARQQSFALDKESLNFEDLEKLDVLTRVMKESLRLCPPVPGMPRKVLRDTEFKGVRIPAGSLVNLNLAFMHRMREYWKNPDQFDPDRFSDERAEQKAHPFAWSPYGGGAHMCLGMHFADLQVKSVLHQTLRKYRWRVPTHYLMRIDWTSLPKPLDDLPVTLERL